MFDTDLGNISDAVRDPLSIEGYCNRFILLKGAIKAKKKHFWTLLFPILDRELQNAEGHKSSKNPTLKPLDPCLPWSGGQGSCFSIMRTRVKPRLFPNVFFFPRV